MAIVVEQPADIDGSLARSQGVGVPEDIKIWSVSCCIMSIQT